MTINDYQRISGFEKAFSSFFVDPLYGEIGLTETESKLVTSGIFRRLKRIKQLGLVNEFYNGATHTRYEHSLGTLHITWVMFKRFVDNVQKYNKWLPKNILKLFPDDTIEALRTSALLHDLSHGPYSHYIEDISDYLGVKLEHDVLTPFLIANKDKQKQLSKILYKAIYGEEKAKNLFLQKRKELLDALPRNRIFRNKILGIIAPKYKCSDENFNKVRQFLHCLIYGDLGSDRIDYLLRDTHYTGLGHRFDMSELLNNVAAIYDEINNELRFAFHFKGMDICDFFLTTRYYHYRLIAHNLKNIDLFCKLKERVEKWLNQDKGNNFFKLLDLMFKDEIYFEKIVPPLKNWNFKRVGNWSLGKIRVNNYRFLVYRLMSDNYLKHYYLNSVKESLCNGIKKFQKIDLNKNDLRIEFVLEKTRIPIIPAYRESYLELKSSMENKKEEEQISSLIHDDSEMINSLARTYLSHTNLIVYANKKYDKVMEYISKTPHFFLNRKLFCSVLSHLSLEKINRLDIMLCCLNYLFEKKIEVNSLKKITDYLKLIQRKFPKIGYTFDRQEGYDPQRKNPFDYPPSIINDLILFEYAGLITLSKKNRDISWFGHPPRYMDCYNVDFPRELGFKEIIDCYPRKFKQKIEQISKIKSY